jgi:two-component system, response regulator PdtaR
MLVEDLEVPFTAFAIADEALMFLQGHAEDIDLLFTDITIPGRTDGLELAREVADVTSGNLKDTPRRGARFLQKPFDAQAMISAIQAARGRFGSGLD